MKVSAVISHGGPQVIVPPEPTGASGGGGGGSVGSELWQRLNSIARVYINEYDCVPRLPSCEAWLFEVLSRLAGVSVGPFAVNFGGPVRKVLEKVQKNWAVISAYRHVGRLLFISDGLDHAMCLDSFPDPTAPHHPPLALKPEDSVVEVEGVAIDEERPGFVVTHHSAYPEVLHQLQLRRRLTHLQRSCEQVESRIAEVVEQGNQAVEVAAAEPAEPAAMPVEHVAADPRQEELERLRAESKRQRSEIEEIKALLKEKADLTYVDTQVSHVQADLVQRMEKMRMAIHEDLKSCATIEQVTAMLQEKEHQILEFVGEIVKKVPRPIRIEVKKKYLGTRKVVKLTFKCPRSGTELVVKSTSWSLWLKFAVVLLQTGESILQADIGGAVEGGVATLQAAYNAYHESQADHESFDALMHAPLLLSSEQDELIAGLRKEGFFEKFSYNEQMGQWEFGHAARAPSALAPAPPPNMPPNPPVAPVAAGVDEL